MDPDAAQSPRPAIWKCLGLAVFLVTGYLSPLLISVPLLGGVFPSLPSSLPLLLALPFAVAWLRARGLGPGVIAAEFLVFVVLVIWGIGLSHIVGPSCVETACDPANVHRPLAEPGVFGLSALHALSVFAYAVSRRRPELLSPGVEVTVLSGLLLGLLLQTLLAIHFGVWLLAGLVVAPAALPAASPLFAIVLFGLQLRKRLKLQVATLGLLSRAVGLLGLWMGLYIAVTALFARRATAAFDVFAKTCGYTFSHVPIVVDPTPCGHYLCTVAACGHPQLVKPLRVGLRRGQPILVNRQLAIANAFEELLIERAPRLGKAARQLYDRLGLPISRYIQSRAAADLVYLAMKPAEWCFYGFLLLADPGCPETRLERMYQPKSAQNSPEPSALA